MRRRLERQRHDAATAERAARAERGAETERRERQAQLLLRPVRAQQPLWPHPWRPLQLAMHADALRYKQGKKEIAIPLRHVTHVNVVDNDRYLPPSTPPLPPTPPAPRPTTRYSLYSLLTTHHSPLTTHHSPLTTHHGRCEFAILSQGRTAAFRAADASAMAAWVQVLRSKEGPPSPGAGSPTGSDTGSPVWRAAP